MAKWDAEVLQNHAEEYANVAQGYHQTCPYRLSFHLPSGQFPTVTGVLGKVPEILNQFLAVVESDWSVCGKVFDALSANLSGAATHYRTHNAENLDAIAAIWEEYGPPRANQDAPTRTAPPEYGVRRAVLENPGFKIRTYEASKMDNHDSVMASALTAWSSARSGAHEIARQDFDAAAGILSSNPSSILDGKLQPVTDVAELITNFGSTYRAGAMGIENASAVIFNWWEGPSANHAADVSVRTQRWLEGAADDAWTAASDGYSALYQVSLAQEELAEALQEQATLMGQYSTFVSVASKTPVWPMVHPIGRNVVNKQVMKTVLLYVDLQRRVMELAAKLQKAPITAPF